ncbi:Sel1 domain-containing protein repeat-containing protein [Cupriavidus basilensis OR16]|uniref:Sel1 domain-containing protein repeat-containing protein n=1 Tax=Cupriavidus basilensis OR16 TaxID=1127483 RepID=H1SA46_9BURK|nr:Sel1 domain-containing protein repeat-containing protein [Cupriavidus basilensis OR16]
MLGFATISVTAASAWAGEAEDLCAAMGGGKREPAAATLPAPARGDVATAQANLALAYLYGTGVRKDTRARFDLPRKAAGQEEADSREELGHAYSQGYGVPKEEAGRWSIARRSDGRARRGRRA